MTRITTLPPMSASVCAPHFLVLPAVRPLSQAPPCCGRGSRVSHAPRQLHVRRHGTALPLHYLRTDAVARFGRKLGKRFTLDGQHGPAPHVVDEKTGFNAHRASAQSRSSTRPSDPLRAVATLPSAPSVARRGFVGRCCVDRIALRSWSCQSAAPLARAPGRRELRDRSQLNPFGAGAARAHACGHRLRAIAESLPTPDLAKRAWTNPRRESRSADKPCPDRWARDRGGRFWSARRSGTGTPLVNFVNAAS